jgi:uncharacterized protein YnzC (UPF0291/DUF896 family)
MGMRHLSGLEAYSLQALHAELARHEQGSSDCCRAETPAGTPSPEDRGSPEVIAAIAEARSHGDLSENAEYDAAKERQGFIEGRIREVEGKLSNAQIIDPKLLDADGRCVFATVELEDLDTGDTVTYQIVGDDGRHQGRQDCDQLADRACAHRQVCR